MSAIAITDRGNMMGCFHFIKAIKNYNSSISEDSEKTQIKPIIGCELNVCSNHKDKSNRDDGYQIVFLAKNKNGYRNLSKMCSIGYTEGFYYVPRVDRSIIEQYKSDLIVLSGNMYGEIANKLLNIGESQAEDALMYWKNLFGDDFYLEMMKHGQEDEDRVNETLLEFSKSHNIKVVPTNNSFYLNKEDANAHDILLCVKDGEKQATPIGRGRGFRYGLKNQEYYFKTSNEMKFLFRDYPDFFSNISEIVEKVELYELAREVLLPKFKIPADFKTENSDDLENEYLKFLTFNGAKKHYKNLDNNLNERILFELNVIKSSGYPGYFLIVQDLIKAAIDMGVSVGPGRGSAAGSVVAYCLGITKIDPIKYDLLFERFLNPDRVSMPDIDIDFDDEGRSKVIQYVIDKYGSSQVAQIITYGSMAAKSSIRDTGRVLDLSLNETDRIAKLVPDIKLNTLFNSNEKKLSEKLNSDQIKMALDLKKISEQNNLEGEVVRQAKLVEGSVRNTGIHACGVIITPSDIREFVPVARAKDSEMWCTQFDNSVAENAGLLKMDFLGLKTLTLIKDTVKIIEARTGEKIDIENVPLDDEQTYQLFQRGETIGVFQYESQGMQKHLKSLKPTEFSDLIAMNALYRPGPLEYIPSFIKRKHGNEEIKYDLPEMEEYLKETYGITVYQEQVMLLSQKLVGFTKGEADTLRKAMGKKKFDLLAKMKPKFLDQGEQKGHNREILEKIWKDWEAFASYAFNKSHSTCYALIAYHTAYLKARYPAEYMAAVLSNNMKDIKKVSFFMEECNRMGLQVLGPDVNESWYKFAVNDKGEVRFGLGAILGVGEGAVKNIVSERKNDGLYGSIFEFVKRINLRDCNRTVLENFAMAGAFDSFSSIHRAQYFKEDEKGNILIDKVIKYGQACDRIKNSTQTSIFDSISDSPEIPEPKIPEAEPWNTFEKLNKEKELVGIYISGHPLEDYQIELDNFRNISINVLQSKLAELPEKEFSFIGIVNKALNLESRRGNKYGVLEIQDMMGSMEFRLFGDQYLKFSRFFVNGCFLHITGKIQLKPRHYNSDGKQKEFKIQHIELLSEVLEKKVNKIYLRWDANSMDALEIQAIDEIFLENKGSKPVYFELVDKNDFSSVVLASRNLKISLSNLLLDQLKQQNSFLGYSVNQSKINEFVYNLKLAEHKKQGEINEPSLSI